MTDAEIQTLDQQEARFAIRCIEEVKESNESVKGDYFTQVKQLPTRILSNGLGQSLAFLFAKSEKKTRKDSGHRLLYDHIAEWLEERTVYPEKGPLLETMMQNDMSRYIEAQYHALRFLEWLVKFARAHLSTQKEN